MSLSERFILVCAAAAASVLSGALYADGSHRFPQVAATSLAGRALSFPADFGSPAALVFVAFAMKQQSEIDAWKHFVDAARAKRPFLPVWELPVIGSGYRIMRGFIEGGMRSGITSQAARETTVTLFLDAKTFADNIGATGRGEIITLVVAPDGRILGSAGGKPNPGSESVIASAISEAFADGR